jgi:drug/metabolite transporter (DMT)-like permease
VTAVAVLLCVVPFISTQVPSLASVLWGMGAGASGVTGAMALYLGFRHAAFSVASSVSAVGSAAFSVLAGVALGEQPGALSLAGIALALPAIVAVSTPAGKPATTAASPAQHGPGPVTEEPGRRPSGGSRGVVPPGKHGFRLAATGHHAAGVGFGLVAGAGFGLFFIGLNEAGSGSDLWPVVIAQVAATVTVICVAAATRDLGLPPAGARRLSVLTGTIGATGTAMFFVATHHGLLAITAVITSLYPGGTILLARLLSGERLTALRIIGLCLAGASVGLIAASGTG